MNYSQCNITVCCLLSFPGMCIYNMLSMSESSTLVNDIGRSALSHHLGLHNGKQQKTPRTATTFAAFYADLEAGNGKIQRDINAHSIERVFVCQCKWTNMSKNDVDMCFFTSIMKIIARTEKTKKLNV